jgi:flavin reductase
MTTLATQPKAPPSDADASNTNVATFRDALCRHCSTVHVITTQAGDIRHGLTCSTVCSVTDSPPTLLFCLHKTVSWRGALRVDDPVCINTLNGDQTEIASVFADVNRIAERFNCGQWTTLATGAPVLEDALTSCDCVVSQTLEVGDHVVIWAKIIAIRLGPQGSVLAYLNRTYRRIIVDDVIRSEAATA